MKLFETYKSKTLDLANRVVMAPMTRSRADNEALAVTKLQATYYSQRASAGLIITEGTTISPKATGYINVPGIYSKPQINGWKLTTDAVHQKGGKIFAQLWHVGRVSHPNLINEELPLAPSAINPLCFSYTLKGKEDTVTPRAMTLEDIHQTITEFQQAAVNAMDAGFDGVEIQAANGYLINQFFAKCANIRTDEYGGSIENRSRFLFELLEKVGESINLKKVGIRISPTFTNTFGMTTDDETEALYEYICTKLNEYDLAYLHIAGFAYDSPDPQTDILNTAKHYRSFYKGNYIINGGFKALSANEAIETGSADLVSFGKLYISNPDLVERFKSEAPLNELDADTLYTGGEKGYTDYPTLIDADPCEA